MTRTDNQTLKLLVLTVFILTTCHQLSAEDNTVANSGPPQKQASELDAPVVRVGSEVIRRRDLEPPPESESVRLAYQMEVAFKLVVEKSRIVFCQQADCTPDPKDVASWNAFMQKAKSSMDPQVEAGYELFFKDEPALWQAKKALYERYGGRVTELNLGGWEPIEARLRLVEDMEKRGALEFYDPQVRADVMESFRRYLQGSFEVDEAFRQREGKRDPWKHPWWQPTQEEMQQKSNAGQSKP